MNKWLFMMLKQFLTVVTPQIRADIFQWLDKLEEQAKATPNPFDDLFVGFLKLMFRTDEPD